MLVKLFIVIFLFQSPNLFRGREFSSRSVRLGKEGLENRQTF